MDRTQKKDNISQIAYTAEPILTGTAKLIVPTRKSWNPPPSQRLAEPFGNAFWKELTGKELDMWFGPRTWKRDLSFYFTNYNREYGDFRGSIFIPVLRAIHDRKKVEGVEVNYTHPKEQTALEEHNISFYKKRINQLENLINVIETEWNRLQGKK